VALSSALTVVLSIGAVSVGASSAGAAAIRACNDTVVVVDTNTTTWYEYRATLPSDSAISQGAVGGCYEIQGQTGAEVKALQQTLNSCYGESLTTDGVFGALTTAAVKRTQGKVGVTQDGQYGPKTGAAMKWKTSYNGQTICRKVVSSFFS
jgi:murein L,D-transpeptidase YcbB/YkuD